MLLAPHADQPGRFATADGGVVRLYIADEAHGLYHYPTAAAVTDNGDGRDLSRHTHYSSSGSSSGISRSSGDGGDSDSSNGGARGHRRRRRHRTVSAAAAAASAVAAASASAEGNTGAGGVDGRCGGDGGGARGGKGRGVRWEDDTVAPSAKAATVAAEDNGGVSISHRRRRHHHRSGGGSGSSDDDDAVYYSSRRHHHHRRASGGRRHGSAGKSRSRSRRGRGGGGGAAAPVTPVCVFTIPAAEAAAGSSHDGPSFSSSYQQPHFHYASAQRTHSSGSHAFSDDGGSAVAATAAISTGYDRSSVGTPAAALTASASGATLRPSTASSTPSTPPPAAGAGACAGPPHATALALGGGGSSEPLRVFVGDSRGRCWLGLAPEGGAAGAAVAPPRPLLLLPLLLRARDAGQPPTALWDRGAVVRAAGWDPRRPSVLALGGSDGVVRWTDLQHAGAVTGDTASAHSVSAPAALPPPPPERPNRQQQQALALPVPLLPQGGGPSPVPWAGRAATRGAAPRSVVVTWEHALPGPVLALSWVPRASLAVVACCLPDAAGYSLAELLDPRAPPGTAGRRFGGRGGGAAECHAEALACCPAAPHLVASAGTCGTKDIVQLWDLRSLARPCATRVSAAVGVAALSWSPFEACSLAVVTAAGEARLLSFTGSGAGDAVTSGASVISGSGTANDTINHNHTNTDGASSAGGTASTASPEGGGGGGATASSPVPFATAAGGDTSAPAGGGGGVADAAAADVADPTGGGTDSDAGDSGDGLGSDDAGGAGRRVAGAAAAVRTRLRTRVPCAAVAWVAGSAPGDSSGSDCASSADEGGGSVATAAAVRGGGAVRRLPRMLLLSRRDGLLYPQMYGRRGSLAALLTLDGAEAAVAATGPNVSVTVFCEALRRREAAARERLLRRADERVRRALSPLAAAAAAATDAQMHRGGGGCGELDAATDDAAAAAPSSSATGTPVGRPPSSLSASGGGVMEAAAVTAAVAVAALPGVVAGRDVSPAHSAPSSTAGHLLLSPLSHAHGGRRHAHPLTSSPSLSSANASFPSNRRTPALSAAAAAAAGLADDLPSTLELPAAAAAATAAAAPYDAAPPPLDDLEALRLRDEGLTPLAGAVERPALALARLQCGFGTDPLTNLRVLAAEGVDREAQALFYYGVVLSARLYRGAKARTPPAHRRRLPALPPLSTHLPTLLELVTSELHRLRARHSLMSAATASPTATAAAVTPPPSSRSPAAGADGSTTTNNNSHNTAAASGPPAPTTAAAAPTVAAGAPAPVGTAPPPRRPLAGLPLGGAGAGGAAAAMMGNMFSRGDMGGVFGAAAVPHTAASTTHTAAPAASATTSAVAAAAAAPHLHTTASPTTAASRAAVPSASQQQQQQRPPPPHRGRELAQSDAEVSDTAAAWLAPGTLREAALEALGWRGAAATGAEAAAIVAVAALTPQARLERRAAMLVVLGDARAASALLTRAGSSGGGGQLGLGRHRDYAGVAYMLEMASAASASACAPASAAAAEGAQPPFASGGTPSSGMCSGATATAAAAAAAARAIGCTYWMEFALTHLHALRPAVEATARLIADAAETAEGPRCDASEPHHDAPQRQHPAGHPHLPHHPSPAAEAEPLVRLGRRVLAVLRCFPRMPVPDRVAVCVALLLPPPPAAYTAAHLFALRRTLRELTRQQFPPCEVGSDGCDEDRSAAADDSGYGGGAGLHQRSSSSDSSSSEGEDAGGAADGGHAGGGYYVPSVFLAAAVEETGGGAAALQRYVDATGDVQTALCYAAAFGLATSGAAAATVGSSGAMPAWREAYREWMGGAAHALLRSRHDVAAVYMAKWRAEMDIAAAAAAAGAGAGARGGGAPLPYTAADFVTPAPLTVELRCNCGQPMHATAPSVSRAAAAAAAATAGRQQQQQQQTAPCGNPECRQGLCPLCTVCGERVEHRCEETPLERSFTWCVVCLHGGHWCHLREWFAKHSKCPVESCVCHCRLGDQPTV